MAHKTIDTLSNLLEAMRIYPTNHTIHVERLPESIEASNVNYKLVGAAHYTVGGGHLTIRRDRPDYVENCPILSHYFNELSAFSCLPDVNNKIAPYIYSNLIDNMLTSLIKENYNCSLDKSRLRFSEIVKYILDHYNEQISLSDLFKTI